MDPPLPNQGWESVAFWLSRGFVLDLRDGGLLFYFILSNIAGRKTAGQYCYEANCFEDYTNREEKSLRQVAKVAIFLDDKKPKISLKK